MKRYCPICEKYSPKFKHFGYNPREDALCPHCGALERHRFVWFYLSNKTNFLKRKSKKMLHVAPEKSLQPIFEKHLKENYLSADLHSNDATVEMDITDINYPDNYFDYIYCSHVLEHVIEDKKAMSEFYRVLNPNGWAILLVPIHKKRKTFEDHSVTDPKERLKLFGQEDHVRIYGTDFSDRLKSVDFNVKVILPDHVLSEEQIILMGITKAAGEIFFCTKGESDYI